MLPTITVQAAEGMPIPPLRLGPDPPAPEMEASPDPPAPAREASRSPRKHARGKTIVSRHTMDSFATRMDKIEHQLDRVNDRFSHISKTLADVKTSNTQLGEEIKKSASSKPTNDARPAARDLVDLIKKLSAAADSQKSVDDLASRAATTEKTLTASIEAQTKRLDNYTNHLLRVEQLCRDGHGRVDFWAKEVTDAERLCRDCSHIYNMDMDDFRAEVDGAFRGTYDRFNKALHCFYCDMEADRLENMRRIADQTALNDTFSRRIGSLNRRLYEMEQGRVPEKGVEKGVERGVDSTAAARLDYLDIFPPRLSIQTMKPRPLSI